MKKIFEAIGLLSLLGLSLLGTNELKSVIKENDDIMVQIKEASNQYNIKPIDAVIIDNTIIPGLSGKAINIKKSYKEMKKINKFNSNLLVYEDTKPNTSIDRTFNKIIIGGNKSKNFVSLVFLVSYNDNVDNIIKLLGDNKVSFFVDEYWFETNNQKVVNIINDNHNIGNLVNESSNISWMNSIIKIAGQNNTFCYEDNERLLNKCALNESYTIRPSIIADVNPLIKIKENLDSGSIIVLKVNERTIKELPSIINYIKSKDFKLVNLEDLISEKG